MLDAIKIILLISKAMFLIVAFLFMVLFYMWMTRMAIGSSSTHGGVAFVIAILGFCYSATWGVKLLESLRSIFYDFESALERLRSNLNSRKKSVSLSRASNVKIGALKAPQDHSSSISLEQRKARSNLPMQETRDYSPQPKPPPKTAPQISANERKVFAKEPAAKEQSGKVVKDANKESPVETDKKASRTSETLAKKVNRRKKLEEARESIKRNAEKERSEAKAWRDRDLYLKQIRQSPVCPYCLTYLPPELNNLVEQDHIYPIASGGKTLPENLVFVCTSCNQEKSYYGLAQFCDRTGKDLTAVINALIKLGKKV